LLFYVVGMLPCVVKLLVALIRTEFVFVIGRHFLRVSGLESSGCFGVGCCADVPVVRISAVVGVVFDD